MTVLVTAAVVVVGLKIMGVEMEVLGMVEVVKVEVGVGMEMVGVGIGN